MITVPAAWLAAADATHAPLWRVLLSQWDGATQMDERVAEVVGGSLSRDGVRWPRVTADLQIPATGSPSLAPAHLKPFGTRVRLQYKVDNAGGDWVDMARLHVVRSLINRPQGMWTLECVDSSGLLQEDIINARRPANLTGTIGAVVTGLVRRTLGASAVVSVSGPAATETVPADWKADKDPWRCIEQLTDLAGADVSVVANSWITFKVAPLPALGVAVDTVAVERNLTGYGVGMERTWNAVCLEYRSPTNNATVTRTGWWTDTRAASVLNPSKIGHHVTLFRQAEGTPSQVQADQAAATIGARETGRARSVRLTCVPRPWIEPGDTVTLTYAGGPTEPALITGVDVPLDGSGMGLDTRNNAYVEGQV
jgi:hypothetical protein